MDCIKFFEFGSQIIPSFILSTTSEVPPAFVAITGFLKYKNSLTKVLHLIKNGNLKKLKILNIKKFKKKYDSFLQEKKASNSFFIWKVINAEYFLEAYKNQIK